MLGLRPEDISLLPSGNVRAGHEHAGNGHAASHGAGSLAVIDGTVGTVEPLGAEFLLSFALGPHEIVAKIAGRALPQPGEKLKFAVNMAHAHVFDAATGQSLRG